MEGDDDDVGHELRNWRGHDDGNGEIVGSELQLTSRHNNTEEEAEETENRGLLELEAEDGEEHRDGVGRATDSARNGGKVNPLNRYTALVAAFATVGGVLFGYDIGVIGGALVMTGFRETFGWPIVNATASNSCDDVATDPAWVAVQTGWVVSSFLLACAISSTFAGYLADRLGRRKTIVVGAFIFTVGGVLQAASTVYAMLLVGRMVAGVSIGILSTTIPMFLTELAPSEVRGRLVSLQQLAIQAGITGSFLLNLGVQDLAYGWRLSLGVQALLSLILLVGMGFMPETPRWLVRAGRNEEALLVLTRTRTGGEAAVRAEHKDIVAAVEAERERTRAVRFRDICAVKVRLRTIIGVLVMFFQQATGVNVVMFYAPTLFTQSLCISGGELLATAITGVSMLLATVAAVMLIDRQGRRKLLLIGSLGMLVSLLCAAIVLTAVDVKQSPSAGYLIVVLICSFVSFFALSWGPIGWTLPPEIYPLELRGRAMALTTFTNWTCAFTVGILTPILLSSAGTNGTFFMLSVSLFLGFLYVWLFVPETKQKSLEDMEMLFRVQSRRELARFVHDRFHEGLKCH